MVERAKPQRKAGRVVVAMAGATLAVAGILRLLPLPRPPLRTTQAPPALASKSHTIVLAPAEHAAADVGRRFIAASFAVLLVTLAVTTLCVLWVFPMATLDRKLNAPLPVYPAPQLQTSPRADMRRFLAEKMQALGSYGWIDKAHGVVRIPIDVAMGEIAQRGIPDWPAPAGPPSTVNAHASASAAATGSTP